MALDNLKNGVMALVFVALLIAALALALDGFQTGLEGDVQCTDPSFTWNTTAQACDNTTNLDEGMLNSQYNITQEGLSGTANASGYLDTIGTLLGVAALVAIVVGAFWFARK